MAGSLLGGAFNQAINAVATPITLPLQVLGIGGGAQQGSPTSNMAGNNANAGAAGSMLNFQKAQQTTSEKTKDKQDEQDPSEKPRMKFSQLLK